MRKAIRRPVYFPEDWELDRCFEAAAGHGFEGIELIFRSGLGPVRSETRSDVAGADEGYRAWQSLGASVTYETTAGSCAEIARRAGDHGLEIVGLASGYSVIDEPDGSAFTATATYLGKAIERTGWLGGSTVLIAFEAPPSETPHATARAWAGELLRRLSDVAADHEVDLAYELVWPAIYETPAEMLEILDAAGSPHVGIYFDPANVLERIASTGQEEGAARPETWLHDLLPYVKNVHMKDYARGQGFVDLLTGDVDWRAIRRHLEAAGYDGWLVAETEIEPDDHLRAIGQAGAAIDRFLEGRL
jgi:hexulose-6-phosphate isomerase